MTATAGTTVHTFTASAADRTRCAECGKSRNTSVHGYNAKARSAAQAGAQAAATKAEKVTAKAKAQADTAAAAEDAVAAVYEKFAAKRAEAPLAVVTLDGEETTVQVEETPADARSRRAAELAEAVNAGTITFDAAAAELLGGKAEAYATETTAPTPREAAESDLYDAVRDAEAAEVTETPAKAAPTGHRISWFVYLHVDGVRTRYSSSMTGDLPAWDLTCSCGWDSKTGGATKGAVRKLMTEHKAATKA